MLKIKILLSTLIVLFIAESTFSYPYDGYDYTGIRRLARLKLILEGKLKGAIPPQGGQKMLSEIKLNLLGERGESITTLPKDDPVLLKKVESLFPNRDESYSLAVLDVSPGKPFRFASRQIDRQFMPGSVGKLAISAGLFTELKSLYPDSIEKRHELLKSRIIRADRWVKGDSHEIPVFDMETKQLVFRPAKEGDEFSLYEWADHMISASANSAASMVWKEVMLMRAFGKDYPVSYEKEVAFFDTTPKKTLQEMAMSIVNDPLRSIGIEQQDWQLGSFFTQAGKKIVPSGGSYATPKGVIQYLLALEKGKIVDEWSSLEIKRLMYLTTKRIRYASSPALASAAIFFKSGSQYRCKPEDGFKCGKYMGNVENFMNSAAIIEHPDGRVYLVALMSNVLKKNSAVEHQTLATYIDKILNQ